jgi:hypothetical protein
MGRQTSSRTSIPCQLDHQRVPCFCTPSDEAQPLHPQRQPSHQRVIDLLVNCSRSNSPAVWNHLASSATLKCDSRFTCTNYLSRSSSMSSSEEESWWRGSVRRMVASSPPPLQHLWLVAFVMPSHRRVPRFRTSSECTRLTLLFVGESSAVGQSSIAKATRSHGDAEKEHNMETWCKGIFNGPIYFSV